MRAVERDIDRALTRLRKAIRERGFTQLEVQEALGWGRSYISQLLTQQKALRIDQVLLILNVIGVEPGDFWAEVFQFGPFGAAGTARRRRGARRRAASATAGLDGSTPGAELRRLELLYEGIVSVLKRKGLVATPELADAIARAKSGKVVLPED